MKIKSILSVDILIESAYLKPLLHMKVFNKGFLLCCVRYMNLIII